jgi:hypothetical protein
MRKFLLFLILIRIAVKPALTVGAVLAALRALPKGIEITRINIIHHFFISFSLL